MAFSRLGLPNSSLLRQKWMPSPRRSSFPRSIADSYPVKPPAWKVRSHRLAGCWRVQLGGRIPIIGRHSPLLEPSATSAEPWQTYNSLTPIYELPLGIAESLGVCAAGPRLLLR